jgi:prevent-host-death family protein
MRTWKITEARAHIADVVDAAIKDGPQRIERRDTDNVVVVSEAVWNRLAAEYPSFADLILNAPIHPGDIPPRRPARVIAR